MHQKLVPHHYLILVNNQKYSQCNHETLSEDILKEDYRKSSEFSKSFFVLEPYWEKQEGPEASYWSFFRLSNISIRSLSYSKSCNFNLPKSIHVIIFPFLLFSLNLATLDKKEENYKNL